MNDSPLPAIETDSLTKRFGDLCAVDRLTLTVTPGELFGLVGSDGAGKTTTMRMLAGVMDPSSGTARVLGHDATREAEQMRERIGYMSQRFGLYQDLTVLENLHFYADIFGLARKGREEAVSRLLAFSNLTPFKKRQAGNLSGGMKQKLGLACALIHTPEVLFLDEPTNGVDPVSRRDFWRILYQLLREGVTIFVTTAYLDEAERCHRVGLIHKGRLLACDTPKQLRTLIQGSILELRTTDARQTARLLRSRLSNSTVGLFGDRVHLATPTPDQAREQAAVILRNSGIELQSIRVIEPSLEDVFVSVMNSAEGVSPAAG